ncbi:hypothetical protein CALVIDRAFT_549579 [Calocera viscosa TUFC12733]|uniref:CHAT domain-containing protein n=1 Tax=Calocera viscosa (strain TUFC12733) TaxID=1330018 RepID=A0A167MCL2_CALVF|nr:hypothetical protein CALVIDRAFT_549579 [Calocera viscosa TUFC12733]
MRLFNYTGASVTMILTTVETQLIKCPADRVDRALASFEWYGNDSSLDFAIEECLGPVGSTFPPSERSKQSLEWAVLQARCLRLRFDREGSQEDIDASRELLESVLQCSRLDPASKTEALFRLGEVHYNLFDAYCDPDSVQRAHTLYSDALSMSEEQREPPKVIDEIRYRFARSISAVATIRSAESQYSQGIELLRNIINRRAHDDPLRINALLALPVALYFRYRVGGQKDERLLVEGEKHAREGLSLSADLRCRPYMLSALSNILKERYLRRRTAKVIQEAADLGQQGAAMVLQMRWLKTVDRRLLNDFGDTLKATRMVEGALQSMQKAAHYQRLALTGFHPTSSKLPYAQCVMNACITFCNLCEEGGESKHADEAITFGYEALRCFPAQTEQVSVVLAALGWSYALRYSQNGDDKDSEHAISFLEQSSERSKNKKVEWTKFGTPELYRNFGFVYDQKFRRNRQGTDLERAIEFSRLCIDSDPVPNRTPSYLSQLGERLLYRYELTGNPDDLAESIASAEASLSMSSNIRYQRHTLLVRYARSLRRRYEVTRDPNDIQLAMTCISEALDKYKDTAFAHRTLYLSELAAAYQARHSHTGQTRDLHTALDTYEIASTNLSAAIKDRIDAAVAGGMLAYTNQCFWAAAKGYCVAVALLPRLAWIGINTRDRQKKVTFGNGLLACNAAAASIEIGHPEHAVELLEHGRSIIWRSILDLRTDTQDLTVAHPKVAAELLTVAQALEYDESAAPDGSQELEEERSQRRRRLAERWEDIVDQVRQLDGFETFLESPRYDTLRGAARDGPIVIINVSEYRTDALIMTDSQPIQCIPLAGLSDKVINGLAYAWHQTLKSAKDQDGGKGVDPVLRNICRRLWEGGFSQIATALNAMKASHRNDSFRVWLMPTGMLSLLPIHCAGPCQPNDLGMYDFVTSYTGTLSSLICARGGIGRPSPLYGSLNAPCRMLAVAQPKVENFPALPCAEQEIKILLHSSFAQDITFLSQTEATVSRFAAELPRHDWLHCCSHATWNSSDPLDSAFCMKDGKLTLSSLVRLRLRDAQFAFLSACHTARQTSLLPDESMHLAAGMQVSGFRGVLATQWAMADQDGPALTRMFYDYLSKDGRQPEAHNAAEALHLALRQFRLRTIPMYRWALFVHVGI